MARPEVDGRHVSPREKLAFSIAEFCELHDISRAHYFRVVLPAARPGVA
jgi:hypothetical protein